MITEPRAGDAWPPLGVLARLRSAWPPLGRAGTTPAPVAAAQIAVIMVRRVIMEDHAGEHPPGVPGSRTSS
jgi:hypothetical protein